MDRHPSGNVELGSQRTSRLRRWRIHSEMESRAKVFRIVWRTGELLHHPLQRVFLAFYIRRDYVLPSRMRRGHNLIRKLALLPPILTQRASIGSNINLEGECCCRPKSKPTTLSLPLSKPPPSPPCASPVVQDLRAVVPAYYQWCSRLRMQRGFRLQRPLPLSLNS